uniref:Fibronectin type III domain-containing protein n=1 Tax=Candidatus Kentrum eta TaxID=2126337 RepID=A0A450U6U3_9GAMM|nr:MAG: Fibronectin type III domain-containing protein [Candidatus Kentron sp. H]VFJ88955.1 MAG: Fibronectin type III domain-containing protein [Candidatus Kentron sp. H]VFJ95694.1 MAG: Fibronectin type III domain-containing protein [Candidatus Kentron sp. H]
MKFPTKENDILALAEKVVAGLGNNTDTYPAPPIAIEDFGATLTAYLAAKEAETAARAALEESVKAKNAVLESLTEETKKELRYAENTVDYDDAKLKQLGWGGRKSRTPPQVPGQVLSLRALRQGEGRITLAWKAPSEGGTVAAYRIQRLERLVSDADWVDVGTAMGLETALSNQARGKEFEFRVIAANKAGEGEPSNTVMAVL